MYVVKIPSWLCTFQVNNDIESQPVSCIKADKCSLRAIVEIFFSGHPQIFNYLVAVEQNQ